MSFKVSGSLKKLYPFASNYLEIDGHRLHYLDEGEGEPLLMLHGNPTWSFYYRHLVTELKKTHRCIVPDHMGCGLSDKPQDYPYTLKTHIANIERLCGHLQLKDLTLVLHDWGGAIGMGYAVRHPENVKRLVIFNTAAFLSNRIPASINLCRTPILGSILIRCFNAFALGGVLRACKKKERMTPEVRAGYLAPYNSFANRIANLRFVQDIPLEPHVKSHEVVKDIESRLHLFSNHPILIIWGMKDFCFNRHFLKRWREVFPNADCLELPDAGHYVVEDCYEKILIEIKNFFNNR